MKKIVIRILLAIGIVVIIDVVVGIVSEKLLLTIPPRDTQISNMKETLLRQQADVLVLGASSAQHHYDSHILSDSLGMSVYNSGLDGRDMVYVDVAAQAMMARHTPHMVVLDINEYMLNGEWGNRMGDTKCFYGISDQVTRFFDEETDWKQRLKLHSALYRYNKTLSYFIRVTFAPKSERQGFSPIMNEEGYPITLTSARSFQADSVALSHLNHLVSSCKEKQVRLVVVTSPSTHMNLGFEKWLIGYCEKNRLQLLNEKRRREYYGHPEWFIDEKHMNVRGATVFSRHVATYLKGMAS